MRRPTIKAMLPLLALAGPAAAAAEPVAPGRLIEAFNETCRRGFPSFDTIKANALAQGWTETAIRVIVPPRDRHNFNPLVLRKGDVTLFMMAPEPGADAAQACQVAISTVNGRRVEPPAIGALAAAVSAALGAGDPQISASREADNARWRVTGNYVVDASVQIRGPGRMASLVVRREP